VAGGCVANPASLTALRNGRTMSDIVPGGVSRRCGAVPAIDGLSLRY